MPTLLLQPNATAGKDAFIYSGAADTNYGTSATLGVGDLTAAASAAYRSLISFTLPALPTTTLVSDATLSLYESTAYDDTSVGSWAVNVRRALRNWGEATGTWNKYDGTNAWTTAGMGSDGNDRSATVSATLTLDGTAASAFLAFTGATLADDVQKFFAGTYSNYGWLIEAPSAENQGSTQRVGNVFHSSDYNTDPTLRPKLSATYTVPWVCSPIGSPFIRGGSSW